MQPILSKWDISWSDRQTFKTIYLVGVENPTFFYTGQENLCRDVGCRLHRHGRGRRRCRRCRHCRHSRRRQIVDFINDVSQATNSCSIRSYLRSSVDWVNVNGIKVTWLFIAYCAITSNCLGKATRP